MKYQKPPLTFDQQLDLLVSRGLRINDRDFALVCLRNISYYRLSAYFLPFKDSEKFQAGVNLADYPDYLGDSRVLISRQLRSSMVFEILFYLLGSMRLCMYETYALIMQGFGIEL